MVGFIKGLEKRVVDKDKLVAATIELEILKATEKLRLEFRRTAEA